MPIVSDLQDIVNSRPELGWQQAGKEDWLFRCPLAGHGQGRGDRSPSAKLFRNAITGKPTVVCHAGCDTAALRTALGLPNSGDAPTRQAMAPAHTHAALPDGVRLIPGTGYPALYTPGESYDASLRRVLGDQKYEFWVDYTLADGTTGRHIRSYPDKRFRWDPKGCKVTGLHAQIWPGRPGTPLVIGEGELVATAIASLGGGYRAVSYNGVNLAASVNLSAVIADGAPIIIFADTDKAGLGAGLTLLDRLLADGLDPSLLCAVNPARVCEHAGGKVGAGKGKDAVDVAVEIRESLLNAALQAGPDGVFAYRAACDAAGAAAQKAAAVAAPAQPLPAWDWDCPAEHQDRYGRWAASVAADTARTLRANAGRLLVALQKPAAAALLYDAGVGVWAADTDGLRHIIEQTRSDWAKAALDHAPESDAKRAIAWRYQRAKSAGAVEVIDYAGAIHEGWLAGDTEPTPQGLSVCQRDDMDMNTRYLGCGNGVIDLDTGELLIGDAARECLVTAEHSVSVDYRPGATHPAVEKLFAHLPAQEMEWLLAAGGYALRGVPNGRLYLLVGPGGGGKSTALDAIANALGNAGGKMPNTALQKSRQGGGAARPDLLGFQQWRIATVTESPEGRAGLDTTMLKQAAGGENVGVRDLYEAGLRNKRPTTATMFWAANEETLPALPMNDSGWVRRLRILRYPAIPELEQDGNLRNALAAPEAREALFALLVRYAVANPKPPDDCPSVADARREYRREQIGPAGDWLQNALVKDPQGRVSTGELYDAAFAAAGMDDAVDPDGKPWGKDKASITKLARDLHTQIAPRVIKDSNGKTARGWLGWRLATPAELAAAAAAAAAVAVAVADDADTDDAPELPDTPEFPQDAPESAQDALWGAGAAKDGDLPIGVNDAPPADTPAPPR